MSGIITQEKGVNYLWHNPFVFFSSRSFTKFLFTLRQEVGQEVDEFMLWLGLLQGRNSTRMLGNRFGIDKKDLQSFIDGATIIGMGHLTLTKANDDFTAGIIEGVNSVLAKEWRTSDPHNNHPVDHYLCGILAGGAELLVGLPMICTEQQCIGKGDTTCIYDLRPGKEEVLPTIRKNINSLGEYEKKITKYYLNKMPFLKLSFDKKFSIQDGAFYLNHIQGFNLEVYLILLFELYFRKHHPKAYQQALAALFHTLFEELIGKEQQATLNKVHLEEMFKRTSIIGLGTFTVKHAINKRILIESLGDPLISESRSIFGHINAYEGEVSCLFLQTLINYLYGKKCSVKHLTTTPGKAVTALYQADC